MTNSFTKFLTAYAIAATLLSLEIAFFLLPLFVNGD